MFERFELPPLQGFRFPRSIISCAVWAYHRFALSIADVEDLLAERGVRVSREMIRKWVNRFGRHFTRCIRRARPKPNSKGHLDENVIVWRDTDGHGDVSGILWFNLAGM